jgi:hypothetical protein
MAHYTIDNFWIDKDDSKLPTPAKVYPLAIDTISSEHDGQVTYYNLSSKDYASKASAETHVSRIEKKEYPNIKVTRKPSKRKMSKHPFIQVYSSPIDNSVVIGKITPLEHGMKECAQLATNHIERHSKSSK